MINEKTFGSINKCCEHKAENTEESMLASIQNDKNLTVHLPLRMQ